MLISKETQININSSNIKYYEEKGYEIPKYIDKQGRLKVKRGTTITVLVDDLSPSSTASVKIQCDYCGKTFERLWNNHRNHNSNIYTDKDACNQCKNHKSKESNIKIYGNEYAISGDVLLKRSNSLKTDYKKVVLEFNERGYEVVTTEEEYYSKIDKRNTVQYLCPKHIDKGILSISWDNFHNANSGCKYCRDDNNKLLLSHFWKGGKNTLIQYLRDNIVEWKKDSMKQCDCKCIITGERFDDIHHLYSFNDIVDESLKELNLPRKNQIKEYTINELEAIKQNVIDKHKQLLGVCLKREVHELFHSEYGNIHNRPNQFYEFMNKYKNTSISL